MRLIRSAFIAFCLVLVISGCAAATPAAGTEFTVTLKNNSIQPENWRVPAGAAITLHLTNQDETDHELLILFRSATAYNTAGVDASTFWRRTFPAGKSETVHFVAPAAAGYYEIVCREALDGGPSARLTVVNLEELHANSQP